MIFTHRIAIRRVLPILLSSLLAGGILLSPSATSADGFYVDDPLILISGTWELDVSDDVDAGTFTCDQDPLVIEYDATKEEYRSTIGGHTDIADILGVSGNVIHLQYREEDRLDASGNPVSWYLHMSGRDQFFWVRNDWSYGLDGQPQGTLPRRRCPDHRSIS